MKKVKNFCCINPFIFVILVILWAIMNVIAFERKLSPTFFLVINSIVFVLIAVRSLIKK